MTVPSRKSECLIHKFFLLCFLLKASKTILREIVGNPKTPTFKGDISYSGQELHVLTGRI